jgi:hypothetical protein
MIREGGKQGELEQRDEYSYPFARNDTDLVLDRSAITSTRDADAALFVGLGAQFEERKRRSLDWKL